jgi:hypothetical protein
MARYTCLVTVEAPDSGIKQPLGQTLESCNFDIIYEAEDYVVAREVPGGVAFPKLVTVEVLIDETPAEERAVRMNFVMKNEELPLQTNNHCRRMFDLVNQAIAENNQWQLIEAVAG